MKNFRKQLYKYTVGSLVIVSLLTALWLSIYNRPTDKNNPYLLLVPPLSLTHPTKHQTVKQIIARNIRVSDVFFYSDLDQLSYFLLANGRIRSSFFFKQLGRFFNISQELKPGIYQIPGGLSAWENAQVLTQYSPKSGSIIIEPGDFLTDIRDKFHQAKQNSQGFKTTNRIITKPQDEWKECLLVIKNYYQIDLLSPKGFIYPGIYFLEKEMNLDQFLTQSIHAFHQEFGKYLKESSQAKKLEEITHLSLKEESLRVGNKTEVSVWVPSFDSLTSSL